jgi:hypothetical protein
MYLLYIWSILALNKRNNDLFSFHDTLHSPLGALSPTAALHTPNLIYKAPFKHNTTLYTLHTTATTHTHPAYQIPLELGPKMPPLALRPRHVARPVAASSKPVVHGRVAVRIMAQQQQVWRWRLGSATCMCALACAHNVYVRAAAAAAAAARRARMCFCASLSFKQPLHLVSTNTQNNTTAAAAAVASGRRSESSSSSSEQHACRFAAAARNAAGPAAGIRPRPRRGLRAPAVVVGVNGHDDQH